jgi:hypothetical protein
LNDVNNIFNLTRGKLITADQMVYIINMVAIPRIEYKANLTIFNESDARMMTAKLRKVMRYKIGVTNTGPNVLLNNKDIFNMIDFFDRQTEAHIANLVLRLNDKGTLGLTTEIRLRELQTKEWLYDNPLDVWNYNNVNLFKNNLIAQILCCMNSLGLAINYIGYDKEYFKIGSGKLPIIEVLKDEYRKNINSLRIRNLMYIDQLIYGETGILKDWSALNSGPNLVFRG